MTHNPLTPIENQDYLQLQEQLLSTELVDQTSRELFIEMYRQRDSYLGSLLTTPHEQPHRLMQRTLQHRYHQAIPADMHDEIVSGHIDHLQQMINQIKADRLANKSTINHSSKRQHLLLMAEFVDPDYLSKLEHYDQASEIIAQDIINDMMNFFGQSGNR